MLEMGIIEAYLPENHNMDRGSIGHGVLEVGWP